MATLQDKQSQMRERVSKRENVKTGLMTRPRIRKKWSEILQNPRMSDQKWMEAAKQAEKFFPEWTEEGRRRLVRKASESDMSVDEMVQEIEREERAMKARMHKGGESCQ